MEAILIKQPPAISFSGNPIPYHIAVDPYGIPEISQDITIQVKIFKKEISGQELEIKNQIFYPKKDGTIFLDIQAYADAYLNYYTPNVLEKYCTNCDSQTAIFLIEFTLKKNQAIIGSSIRSNQIAVIKGGIAYSEWNPADYFSKLFTEKLFLNFSGSKRTFKNDLRFLYFINDAEEGYLPFIRAEITLDDGTTVSNIFTSVNVGYTVIYGVYCIPAGYDQLALDTYVPAGKIPVSYTVAVIGNANVVTVGPYEFIIEQRNFYTPKQLLYRTSTGALETISLRGEVDFEADYSRKDLQISNLSSYYKNLNLQPQQLNDTAEETEKYKGDTGFVSKKEAEILRDLFISSEIFEYRNGKILPIIINTKNVKFYTNRDNLISILLEWRMAWVNQYFTPADLMPATRTCPAVENFVVRQLNKTSLSIFYSLPIPYEKVQVYLFVGGEPFGYSFTGNSGRIILDISDNPYLAPPTNIVCEATVICNDKVYPYEVGPISSQTVSFIGNSLPIVNNDTFDISNPLGTAITLPTSVLANDYDPDGDAIEVVAVTGGTTHGGGTYNINAAGIVSYTPVSTGYSGTDYFDYEVRQVSGDTTTVTGRCFINVGQQVPNVFVKLVRRNVVNFTGSNFFSSTAEIWLDFFSDAFGNVPLDITDRNLIITVRRTINGASPVDFNVTGIGQKMLFYSGLVITANYSGLQVAEYTVQPDIGYIVI